MNTETKCVRTSQGDPWGYAVCFGTVIIFIAGIGHINSFGLVYNDFIVETKSTAKSLTTAHGVFAVMLAIGGLFLSMLSKRYPLRLGGFIGSASFALGAFLTIFITNTNQLSLTFGVLQGIGFGILVPVCYSTLNYYFVTRRTFIMSAIKAVQGIVVMWYPQFVRLIVATYGFRGSLLILAGISLHTIPGTLTIPYKGPTNKRIANDNNLEEGTNLNENQHPLLNKDVPGTNAKKIRSKLSSFGSEVGSMLNFRVLKDLVYCNICLGQSFVNFSDLTFFVLQPMLLFQLGFDKNAVATCISIGAGADVAGRFGLTAISSYWTINTRLLFYIATLLSLLARIAILLVDQYIWIAGLTATLGALRACLHVTSPLVISDHVAHDDFPGAYALFMLATGVVNLIMAPFIGSLKDIYGDYFPAFYALIVCCAPCLILWPLERVFIKK